MRPAYSTLLMLAFLLLLHSAKGQPADSCKHRRLAFHITAPLLTGGSLLGLKTLWYADYPSTSFHWFNDNEEWLQMDKAGHFFSAYQLSSITMQTAGLACYEDAEAMVWSLSLPLVYMGGIELMDGFARDWGASWGDLIANTSGSLLFHGQQWAWGEQRILLKWSFHSTPYAAHNPDLLGKGMLQEMLKDYNGQTYWASFNLQSLGLMPASPKWLNLAIGYGASGMTGAAQNLPGTGTIEFIPNAQRIRHLYLSPDIDLRQIPTRRKGLRFAFGLLNMIKIPLPAIELKDGKTLHLHALYF